VAAAAAMRGKASKHRVINLTEGVIGFISYLQARSRFQANYTTNSGERKIWNLGRPPQPFLRTPSQKTKANSLGPCQTGRSYWLAVPLEVRVSGGNSIGPGVDSLSIIEDTGNE
jgi:hypothetical protein